MPPRAPGFAEQLEAAIAAYDARVVSAGLQHGQVNTDRQQFQLAWVGLDVDYALLHEVAGEFAAIGMDNVIEGIEPASVLAGLWAHGVIIGMLLMQHRANDRPLRAGGSGS